MPHISPYLGRLPREITDFSPLMSDEEDEDPSVEEEDYSFMDGYSEDSSSEDDSDYSSYLIRASLEYEGTSDDDDSSDERPSVDSEELSSEDDSSSEEEYLVRDPLEYYEVRPSDDSSDEEDYINRIFTDYEIDFSCLSEDRLHYARILRGSILEGYHVCCSNIPPSMWEELYPPRSGKMDLLFCWGCYSLEIACFCHSEDIVEHFGVNGLLYNATVLPHSIEDHQRWIQILRKNVKKHARKAAERLSCPMFVTCDSEYRRLYMEAYIPLVITTRAMLDKKHGITLEETDMLNLLDEEKDKELYCRVHTS